MHLNYPIVTGGDSNNDAVLWKREDMDVIFLDIDGVLNSNLWNESHQKEIEEGTLIDRNLVSLLGILVKTTNTKIILSSGWRFWFNKKMNPLRTEAERLVEFFSLENIFIYDFTPDLTTEEIRKTKRFSLVKAQEILKWIELHEEVNKWIVIDDLDLRNNIVFEHLIRTNPEIGLTKQDVELAIKMIKG